jgi:hypothetical protein
MKILITGGEKGDRLNKICIDRRKQEDLALDTEEQRRIAEEEKLKAHAAVEKAKQMIRVSVKSCPSSKVILKNERKNENWTFKTCNLLKEVQFI